MSLCACTGQPIKSLSSCECLLHFTLFISSQTTFPPSWHSSLERTTHVHPLMSQTGAFFMDVQVCVRSAYRYDVVNCPSCVCVCVHACVCVCAVYILCCMGACFLTQKCGNLSCVTYSGCTSRLFVVDKDPLAQRVPQSAPSFVILPQSSFCQTPP